MTQASIVLGQLAGLQGVVGQPGEVGFVEFEYWQERISKRLSAGRLRGGGDARYCIAETAQSYRSTAPIRPRGRLAPDARITCWPMMGIKDMNAGVSRRAVALAALALLADCRRRLR